MGKKPSPGGATQVGLRLVKACPGGHDAGVLWVDEGAKTHRSRYENGGEWSRRMTQHPVTSVAKATKTSARNRTASECRVLNDRDIARNGVDLRLSAAKENGKGSCCVERSFTLAIPLCEKER